MKSDQFPRKCRHPLSLRLAANIFTAASGAESCFGIEELLYTCPKCDSVLLIEDMRVGAPQRDPRRKMAQDFRLQENVEYPGA